jgi:AcrR family transcriptional regulator
MSRPPAPPSAARAAPSRSKAHPKAAAQAPARAPSKARPARSTRSDGSDTRRHILETAGATYAELGHARTTSKEICARAGTNMAAVNYHFGGKDGLYEAVLVEAHRQLVSLDDLQRIAAGRAPARERLSRVLHLLLDRIGRTRQAWGLKVLVQEMMAPSPQIPVLIRQAVLPKVQVLFGILAEILGLPAGHPGVQRAVLFTVVPAVLLLVAPKPMRQRVLPSLDRDPQAAVDECVLFALAGLEALRRHHRPA